MEYLVPHEIETAPNPTAAIIWMHGLGADGYDFAPIVPHIRLPEGLAVRYVFPHAPQRAVTINYGQVMPAWYDVRSFDRDAEQDEAGIRQSQAHITSLIEREGARGIDSRNIVLAGFSQGGVVALQAGLRHPQPLAGIMALSTYLALQESLPAEAAAANLHTPVFMAHGVQDQIIDLDYAEISRSVLEAMGYPVQWHSYDMAHAVCAEEIDAISRFLRTVLHR